jgi:signal transduction histidine kinase
MEPSTPQFPWLELIDRPTFCVKDDFVIATNSEAEKYSIQAGMSIHEIVTENREAYETFQNGNLFLTIIAGNLPHKACITRTEEFDIFCIEQTEEDSQLQALALAAQQLRIPLSNLMTVTDQMLLSLKPEKPETKTQIGQINRSLFRILRIVSNMSDANNYKNNISREKQTVNFKSFFSETIEKIQITSDYSNRKIKFTGLKTAVFGLADRDKLSRAIYNLLANALKFSPADSVVDAKLTQVNNKLSFVVSNINIEPIEDYAFRNRFARKPTIEDDRFGLGLGMTLISSIICAHGGTILVDHPTANVTRVTTTISIIRDDKGTVRSPIFRMGDYAGGRDKGLLELSEILPSEIYKDIN